MAKYRQPFDMLAVAVAAEKQQTVAATARNEIWLPGMDSIHEETSLPIISNLLI
jgi:hypothetical protein